MIYLNALLSQVPLRSILFWMVVSDFGLIEAIESGLVKNLLPESDNTHELTMPVLRKFIWNM
jgi:hypothetical protein